MYAHTNTQAYIHESEIYFCAYTLGYKYINTWMCAFVFDHDFLIFKGVYYYFTRMCIKGFDCNFLSVRIFLGHIFTSTLCAHTHTHIYIYIHTYIHTHTHTHVYIYIYTYIHTHTALSASKALYSSLFLMENVLSVIQTSDPSFASVTHKATDLTPNINQYKPNSTTITTTNITVTTTFSSFFIVIPASHFLLFAYFPASGIPNPSPIFVA